MYNISSRISVFGPSMVTAFLWIVPAVNNVPVNQPGVPGHQVLFTPCQVRRVVLVALNGKANPELPVDAHTHVVIAERVISTDPA